MTFPLSILDLMPVPSGGDGAQALHNAIDLAQRADRHGYHRYWLAEHHSFMSLASAPPEILIGVIAHVTKRIRVGSGGILLPNYAPYKVAEVFRALSALAPGRIDLGIGRAPDQDKRTALALRGDAALLNVADDIGRLVAELEGFAEVAPSPFPADHPLHNLVAWPEGVAFPPIWLLGAGQRSAELAAARGHGFAAAYHFNPRESANAVQAYKTNFRPSAAFAQPRAMAGIWVFCAESNELATDLKRANDLAILRRHRGERSAPPTIEEARAYPFSEAEQEKLRNFSAVVGDPQTVKAQLAALIDKLQVDELILVTNISDHELRCRSFELVAQAWGLG